MAGNVKKIAVYLRGEGHYSEGGIRPLGPKIAMALGTEDTPRHLHKHP
jgi:hypothetical protein